MDKNCVDCGKKQSCLRRKICGKLFEPKSDRYVGYMQSIGADGAERGVHISKKCCVRAKNGLKSLEEKLSCQGSNMQVNLSPPVRIEEPVAGPLGVGYIVNKESGADTTTQSESTFNRALYFWSDEVDYDSEDAPVEQNLSEDSSHDSEDDQAASSRTKQTIASHHRCIFKCQPSLYLVTSERKL